LHNTHSLLYLFFAHPLALELLHVELYLLLL
jgi:hypothetical protein